MQWSLSMFIPRSQSKQSPPPFTRRAFGHLTALLRGAALCAALCALPMPSAQAQVLITVIETSEFRLYDYGSVLLGDMSSLSSFTRPGFPVGDPLVDAVMMGGAGSTAGDVADFDLSMYPTVFFSPMALGPRAFARQFDEVADIPTYVGDLLVSITRVVDHVTEKHTGVGVVPEPGSLALLASGVAPGVGMLLRRRRRG